MEKAETSIIEAIQHVCHDLLELVNPPEINTADRQKSQVRASGLSSQAQCQCVSIVTKLQIKASLQGKHRLWWYASNPQMVPIDLICTWLTLFCKLLPNNSRVLQRPLWEPGRCLCLIYSRGSSLAVLPWQNCTGFSDPILVILNFSKPRFFSPF